VVMKLLWSYAIKSLNKTIGANFVVLEAPFNWNFTAIDIGVGDVDWFTTFYGGNWCCLEGRNQLIFSKKICIDDHLWVKINQNSQLIDKELLHYSELIEDHRRLKDIGWSPPPPNMFKVNVDGSYNINYDISAWGCLIQDVKYHLIKEFVCNLGGCTDSMMNCVRLWSESNALVKLIFRLLFSKLIMMLILV